MAVSLGIQSVTLDENGTIAVLFTDSSGRDWASIDDLTAFCEAVDTADNIDQVQKMVLRWWLLRDPEAQSPGMVIGKTLTFDLTQPLVIDVV